MAEGPSFQASLTNLQQAAPNISNPAAKSAVQNVIAESANGPTMRSLLDGQKALDLLLHDNSGAGLQARTALYGLEQYGKGQLRWDERGTVALGHLFTKEGWGG